MRRLLLFIRNVYTGLVFIILEILALHFYCSSTAYTRARLLTLSNSVVGGVYGMIADVRDYFGLRSQNAQLLERIAELENRLVRFEPLAEDSVARAERMANPSQFEYIAARVVGNTVNRRENYITIDRGELDGVSPNMAILSPQGTLAGYVISCSEHRAVCISALNTSFQTSGCLKNSDHFGSIWWSGADRSHITLSEIPKYAPVEKGDTIVTTSYSFIFPAGVTIGTVEDFRQVDNTASYEVNVRLSTDFTTLRRVLVVSNAEAAEQMYLEQETFGGI